jgi:hypothetical protein
MRAARAIISPLPTILNDPVAPATVAGAIGDSTRRGEGRF